MKRSLLFAIALVSCSMGFAQKILYQQAQTRTFEPMQDVFVRPMVAELEMISTKPKEYPASWQFSETKLGDLKLSDISDAKALATYYAAKMDNADMIIGTTYFIRNHIDEKGKASDYGVDVIVRGYPARYKNWHSLGDPQYSADEKWIDRLIRAQEARSMPYRSSDEKTKAVDNKTK